MTTFSQRDHRIAIIGGGPAGLTLARILHLGGIPCTVFERDTSRSVRGQGGSLDLHPASGQEALKRAGLLDEFEKRCRREGQEMRISDRHGVLHLHCEEDRNNPEIDRGILRDILLDSLPAETVRWGAVVKEVELYNSSTDVECIAGVPSSYVILKDGERCGPFDLVVGADGAWSKVRPLISTIEPFYSGVTILDIRTIDVDRYPEVARVLGQGAHFIHGESDGRLLVSERDSEGIRSYACIRRGISWSDSFRDHCMMELRDMLLRDEFSAYAPEFRRIIEIAEEIIVRPLYMLPHGIKWPARPGATLLGDAAHLMTPFAGQGVNMAMLDGAELGTLIVEGDDLHAAVRSYEKKMFVYAEKMAHKTFVNLQEKLDVDGMRNTAARFGGLPDRQ